MGVAGLNSGIDEHDATRKNMTEMAILGTVEFEGNVNMAESIPKKAVVALSETPEDFWAGRFQVVPPHQARISAFDRSFHFGDSVYEVARTYEGVPFGLREHMDRMERSAKQALFKDFPSQSLLFSMIRKAFLKT